MYLAYYSQDGSTAKSRILSVTAPTHAIVQTTLYGASKEGRDMIGRVIPARHPHTKTQLTYAHGVKDAVSFLHCQMRTMHETIRMFVPGEWDDLPTVAALLDQHDPIEATLDAMKVWLSLHNDFMGPPAIAFDGSDGTMAVVETYEVSLIPGVIARSDDPDED
jgi:hypothetical protein